MKVLHYVSRLVEGDLLADQIEALVNATSNDKTKVFLATSQKAAMKTLEAESPDVLHVHSCWQWLTAGIVRTAHKRGCAVVLSPHGQLSPYTCHHEHQLTKTVRRIIQEQRLTHSYDALLVGSEYEREQLLQARWHDRIDVVASAVLDASITPVEMGQQVKAFYQKVADTRYPLHMTDDEHAAIHTLLHVGSLQDPTKRQVSHEDILRLRALRPSSWRHIMLLADDEDITGKLDIAIRVMQLDAPPIDATTIVRFAPRQPKVKGSLPRTLLSKSRKHNAIISELDDSLRLVLTDFVNVHQLLQQKKLNLRHIAELFETIRYNDFDEDDFRRAAHQMGLANFARRITAILAQLLALDEGYFPTTPLDDRTTRQYIDILKGSM